MNIYLIWIVLYSLTSIICSASSTSSSIFWFTSSPISNIAQQSICTTITGVTIFACLQAPYAQSCMIFSSDCGLQIMSMDLSSKNITTYNLQTNILVQAMYIQPNSQNLWVADANNIYLYQIINPLIGKVQQSVKIAKQQNAGATVTFQYYTSSNRLFVINSSGVSVYNIQDLTQITFVFSILAKSKTFRISVAPNINRISLIDSTLRIIQITDPQDYQNSQQSLSVVDQCSLALQASSVLNEIVNDQYLLIQTNQQIVAGADLSTFLKSGSCSDIVITTLFTSIDTYSYAILTPDKNYLLIGINYLYLQIIQMTYNPLSAQLFQQLNVVSYFYGFSISTDNEYIFISNQDNIDIYERKSPNFNQLIPSIVNIPQMIVFNQFQSNLQYAYSCQYTPVKNYILSAKGTEGTYIFQEDPNSHVMQQVQNVNPPVFSTNLKFTRTFNNDNNLVIGRDNNLYFYDISAISPTSPAVQISTISINKGNQIRSAYITQNMNYIIAAGDSQGIVVIDISTLATPKIVASMYQNLPISSKCEYVIMDPSEQYVFASYQSQGLVIYNMSNFLKPVILSYLTTYGGYNIALFHSKNFLILADVQNGIQVVDISNMSNPLIHATLRTQGSAKECALIYNEQFMLCTARYRGQLQLIDLRDLSNPQIIQTYNYGNIDGGLNICVNTAQNVAYLGLISALVRVNLFPSILFDMDMILISQGSQTMNTILNYNTVLKVGQTVKILLNQVYPSNPGNVNQIKYYYQYKMQELPYWATFSQADSSLILALDKSALQATNSTCTVQVSYSSSCTTGSSSANINQISSQQFIFSVSQQMFMTDFINTNLSITPSLSQQIFIDCILANLITHDYYAVQSSQEVVNYLLSSKYQQNIINYIYYVLSQRNNYFPVTVSVQSSLQVMVDDEEEVPIIKSINNYISVQLQVNGEQAHFISYSYSGVLIYLSAQSDWIQMEGDLDSINIILSQGIKLANYTSSENIPITMTVDDSTNFIVTKTIRATHKYLIQLNKPISNNPELSLNDDFLKKFSSGQIYILDTFNYNFNSLVFLNPDNRPLTYTASIQNDKQYEVIPQSYWLIFQEQERTFFGSTTSSQYRQVVTVMVNATDGYTYATDKFEIYIYLIPLSDIFLYLFQILSPIIGLLGMWKYRSLIYNRMFQRNFKTTRVQVDAGNDIIFQIPLLGSKLLLAQQLWKHYYKTVDKNQVIAELNSINTVQHNNNQGEDSSVQMSRLLSKERCQSVVQNSPINSQRKISKSQNSRYQQQYIKSISIAQKKKKAQQQLQSSLKRSTSVQKDRQCSIGSQYFNSNKTVNSFYILSEVSRHYSNKNKIKDQHTLNQLNNPYSMLSRAIIGLAVIQFSYLELTTIQVMNYLKQIAMNDGYLEIDWYKRYVTVIPQPDNIQDDQFPRLDFNDDQLRKILEDPLLAQNERSEGDIKMNEFKLKFDFIKEVLSAISLGFTLEEKGVIPKIRGECIEVEAVDISSIKSYRPIKSHQSWFSRFHSETLVEKEFFVNQELPSWVQSLDLANDVILIKGKTEKKDIGEYVMNIYTKQNFIIKQVRILIGNNLKDQQKRKSTIQNTEVKSQIQQPFQFQQFSKFFPMSPYSEADSISEVFASEQLNKNQYFEKQKSVKTHNQFFNQSHLYGDLVTEQSQALSMKQQTTQQYQEIDKFQTVNDETLGTQQAQNQEI